MSSTVIQFMAKENENNFVMGSDILNKNIYVDDILPSFSSVEESIRGANEVDKILEKGSFTIKRWYSNDPNIEKFCNKYEDFVFEENIDVLGHNWNKRNDSFDINGDKFNMFLNFR